MKIILLTLLTFFIQLSTQAQLPKVAWSKAIGGTGNERANSVAVDNKGNIILVGRFQSPTITFDNITLTKNTTDNADVADIFILKLDKNGKAIWAITAGDKGDDHAMSCTTDDKNNIYVVGWFESKILKFGEITLSNKTEKGCDMYVAKFSSKGECIWARNAGGEGDNGNYSTIVLDNENNVIIGGNAGPIMDFGNDIRLTSPKGGVYFAKYSNDGKFLWAKGVVGGECHGIAVDQSNYIYGGGFFNDPTKFDNLTLTSNGKADAYVVKFGPDGKAIWAKNLGGNETEIASCQTDPFGNVYLAGLYFSKNIYTETDTITNTGLINAFIAKFDKNGQVLWTKSAGGTINKEQGIGTREFHLDKNGNAFCTGSNSSEFIFGGKSIKPLGSEDIFLLKYDKDGNEIWGVDYGGTGRNAGRGITTDEKGNIYLTGSFEEKQLKIGEHTLNNSGDSDIFVLKYAE